MQAHDDFYNWLTKEGLGLSGGPEVEVEDLIIVMDHQQRKINSLQKQLDIAMEAIDDILDDKQFPQSGYYVDMFNDHAKEAKRKIESIKWGSDGV